MLANFSLLFYLKKPKNYQSGPAPVYLRITANGKPAEISTGRKCEPKNWNTRSGRMTGTREAARSLNAYLDVLQTKVHSTIGLLLKADEEITAQNIKSSLTGKAQKSRSLMSIFESHNQQMAALVGLEYSSRTLQRYRTTLAHLQGFLRWKFSVEDLPVHKVDHAFIADLEFYLRSVCRCNNNTAVKYIKNLGKVIRICMANGWLTVDPFIYYKPKIKKVNRVFLTEGELQAMAGKTFCTERLGQVRDIFLFSCYTGLAYCDIEKLQRNDITKGFDGEQWICINRQKTGTPSRVPLLPPALNIIARYQDHPQCVNQGCVLPVISNQKLNAYLKEIADICGIHKPLTYHIARHTFATTVTLSNGVPIETVSKMLGHTNIKTTQHYAKILDMKVGQDMQVLKKKFAQ